MLDLVDEALDQMPLFVEMSIIRNCARPAGIGGDHGHHVALGHMRATWPAVNMNMATSST